MGNDISAGNTYTSSNPGNQVTPQNLNDHVNEATIKETFLSSKSLKDAAALSDIMLISDGTLKKITLQILQTLIVGSAVLGSANYGDDTVTNLKIAPAAIFARNMNGDAVHGLTLKGAPIGGDEVMIFDSIAGLLKRASLTSVAALSSPPAGSVVQTVYASSNAYSNLSAQIPLDTSIPQSTEGTQILTASITPRYTNSKIRVSFSACAGIQATVVAAAALFRNAGANAIYAMSSAQSYSPGQTMLTGDILDSDRPATLDPITYAVRAGPGTDINGRSIYLNGNNTNQQFGAASLATLIIQEITV